jgi:pimeloyl-ACP methyl ester carboxylesterase
VFFTEIERRFFVDNLETKSIEFSAGANCQMFCKTLIHDLSKPSNHVFPEDSGCATVPVGKETILCLHPLHKLTSSWAWIKFAVTLFRQGFNVILIDLPGFGKSSIGRDVRCPVETWRSWQVTMITLLLQKLGIPKVNILAGYESAEILFDIMHETPNLLGRNHVLYNVRIIKIH